MLNNAQVLRHRGGRPLGSRDCKLRSHATSTTTASIVFTSSKRGTKILHFDAHFGKNWPNNRLPHLFGVGTPVWEILDVPLIISDARNQCDNHIAALGGYRIRLAVTTLIILNVIRVGTGLYHFLIVLR